MAGTFTPKADPLKRRNSDSGYRIGWKLKYGYEKSHIDGEMTYGDAKKKAAEMQAKEPEKVFWAEMMYD